MYRLLAFLLLSAALAFAQGDVAQINGTVTDPQGAVVPGAQIEVLNVGTGLAVKTTSNEHGEYTLPGMPAGSYRVSVTAPGFKKVTTSETTMNAGVPLTVNVRLEIGLTTESVVVTGAAEMVQTSSATVSSTVQTKQVVELPYISRGGMDLFISQPGVQTTGANRNSYINGLPLAAINVTIDGINTQDNYYKNGDGFFTVIPAKQDSLQEITLTTSAGSADANSQGAATVRFVTKSGTNQFHGGVFYQHRNTWLNANSYFNNINGQPRNRQIIHQPGGNIGGPIIKNKLVFFTNLEIFRYPATSSFSRVVMNPADFNGSYTYPITGGTKTINVLTMAGAAGFNTAIDPIVAKTLTQINSYTANGTLQDRIVNNSDYNRNNLLFSPKGMSKNWTDTTRLDYNITDKHTLSLIYTYYVNGGIGDVTNNVFNIYPGTGAIVGLDNLFVNQSGNRYSVSTSLRSSLSPRLTNEFRFGLNRAISMFRPQVSSASQFNEWKGYAPGLGFSLSGVAVVTGSSRRASPVRELHDTVSLQRGDHTLSFGADATQIKLWYVTVGNSVIPSISFGAATNDPVTTGSTNVFTSTSMPGSTSTYQSDAAGLYALLTGRVSSIGRSVAFDGQSYKSIPPTDRDQQYEYGFFAQDSWRVAPSLTLNLGIRFERQQPFQNLDNAYSSVSYQDLWGISGIGHLFMPGTLTGNANPVFNKYTSDYYKAPNFFNPSIGLAWQLPAMNGLLGQLFGAEKGKSVIRAGYAINTVRNGSNTFQSMLGSNQGLNYDTSVSPGSQPQDFGPPGSVLFSQANLPFRSGVPNAPQYPLVPSTTVSLNGYDPNLKIAYVQSWNFGLQRQLSSSTVMEIRYVGNHGLKGWRQMNLNEVNTFENGFQKEFYVAQQNLFINRGCQGSPAVATAWNNCSNPNSNSFANAGLPGQGAIPIISTALATTTDSTTANYLRQNRPSSLASTYSTNATDYGRLIAAGYAKNFFVVNPAVSSGGTWLLTNGGSSFYDALQVEVNRRMSSGVLLQFSYAFSKSLANGSQSSLVDASQPTTFRNMGLDKIPGNGDIRHAFKINGIYELPVGTGRRFLSSTPVLKTILEGWEITGISRIQSGGPYQFTSGRAGMNGSEAGVFLQNMTVPQLQNMVQFRKTTGSNGIGQVFWLPDSLIANTNAAFETNGLSWANVNLSQPFISPQLTPGQFGYQVFLHQPWQYHFDTAVVKRTRIKEKVIVEFQANFMDILNLTNFYISNGPSSTSFGRTTSIYNDLTYNYDPGARVIEGRLRITF
jgi:hypothetical protein